MGCAEAASIRLSKASGLEIAGETTMRQHGTLWDIW